MDSNWLVNAPIPLDAPVISARGLVSVMTDGYPVRTVPNCRALG